MALAIHFVGNDAKVMKSGKGMVSADALRQVRFPAAKSGVDPLTQLPYSKTGKRMNFQARDKPSGRWTDNVHLDIK